MLELVLAEGKKREIRRMLSKLGHKVMSLNRIAVGPISLKGLPVGECRPLSRHEIDLLRKVASGDSVSPPRSQGAARRPGHRTIRTGGAGTSDRVRRAKTAVPSSSDRARVASDTLRNPPGVASSDWSRNRRPDRATLPRADGAESVPRRKSRPPRAALGKTPISPSKPGTPEDQGA